MAVRGGFLGVDLGTSSVKVLLLAEDGTPLSDAREGLRLERPEPLAAEQDAEAWWEATVRAVRRCLAAAPGARVAAVGLTGQKHALLPLDVDRRALGPAVLWADGRSEAEAAEVAALVPELSRLAGAPALPGYLVPKWRRFVRCDPDRARRTAHLCFAKDYLRLRLTGRLATDRTEAAASLVFDLRRRAWSDDLCRRLDLPRRLLPPVLAPTEAAGEVTPEAAAATGLAPGTPVAAGAGDNEAALLGCGAAVPGRAAVVLGTSGTVVAPVARWRGARGLVLGPGLLARGYLVTGVVLSAGRALEWARDLLFPPGTSLEDLVRAAGQVAGDPAPPVFLPSLAGERSPVPDPSAAAAFAGLRPHHGPAHLARAVLEGVALSLAEVLGLLRRAGVDLAEVRVASGGPAGDAVRRVLAAASGVPVRRAGDGEESARGAALLASALGPPGAGGRGLLARAEEWVRPGPAESVPPGEAQRLRASAERLADLRRALGGGAGPRRGGRTIAAPPLREPR